MTLNGRSSLRDESEPSVFKAWRWSHIWWILKDGWCSNPLHVSLNDVSLLWWRMFHFAAFSCSKYFGNNFINCELLCKCNNKMEWRETYWPLLPVLLVLLCSRWLHLFTCAFTAVETYSWPLKCISAVTLAWMFHADTLEPGASSVPLEEH